MRAASRYQVSCPLGTADSVGSPPPFSTTTPGCRSEASTVVVSRASRSSACSAAAVVNTLVTEAGCMGTSAPCVHSCSPVAASVILPVNAPRFGSASVSANVAASLSGVGLSAESETGLIPGSAVAGAGAAGSATASLDWPPCSSAAATTTAATRSTTATPITTWVDRRHWVGRMVLLTPACQRRVSAAGKCEVNDGRCRE